MSDLKKLGAIAITIYVNHQMEVEHTFPNPFALKDVLRAAYEKTVVECANYHPNEKIIPVGMPLPGKDNGKE